MVDVVDAFLRGLERPLILWLLALGPKNGYELMKEVEKLTGRTLKPSVVYSFLCWLEEKGFVLSDLMKRGRRELKFYRLTDKGKGLLMNVRNLFRNPIKSLIIYLLSEHKEG